MQKRVALLSNWKLWQVITFIAICGLTVGVLSMLGQEKLDGNWKIISNSGAIWVVTTFFIGSLMASDKYAAAAGIEVLLFEIIGFYTAQASVGITFPSSIIIKWIGAALVAGTLFGIAGRWWHSEHPLRNIFAITFLGGIFAAEGSYYLLFFHEVTVGWGGIAVGLLIALILGRSVRERLVALLFLPLITFLGVAAFDIINSSQSYLPPEIPHLFP